MGVLLDGISIAALALMAGVAWFLSRDAIVDPISATIFVIALGLLVTRNVSSVYLILAGGAVGLLTGVI